LAYKEKEAYKTMLRSLVHTSKVLRLEVISSASLQKGQVININPLGLCGNSISERERDCPGSGMDGFTYFGSIPAVSETWNDGII